MKKIFLSLVLLLVGGAELFARCPYRQVQPSYTKRQRGGRPYRRLEARESMLDQDSSDEDEDDQAVDRDADEPDDNRPTRSQSGKEYKDVQLDANPDERSNQIDTNDDDVNDVNDDMDLGDLDR